MQGTQPIRGDEALAVGALAAGVAFAAGYPGSPATGVFEALASRATSDALTLEWAPNEKVALEIAAGASLAGIRALVVLKSVGLNIALDPLATLSYVGCHAGLVILVGDDPGGWSSQNEQDSRWLARLAETPVVEPTDVAAAAPLMTQAFAWSESLGLPVIVRLTRALANATAPVPDPLWELPSGKRRFLRKENRWIVYPPNVVRRHHILHHHLRQFQSAIEVSPYDIGCERAASTLGVLAAGGAYARLRACSAPLEDVDVLGLASAWPLPEKRLRTWLAPLRRLLVLEEGGPFVEEQVQALVQREGLSLEVLGQASRALPDEGELRDQDIALALQALVSEHPTPPVTTFYEPAVVSTPLCADCPYRPTFDALSAALEAQGGRGRHLVVGETGCMVRAVDTGLFDVKLSLGAGLGLALGLALDASHHVVALLGDSCFFHSDVNALATLRQRQPPVTVIVLDNGSTALTGGQPHPGSAFDARRQPQAGVAIEQVAAGYGLSAKVATPDDPALRGLFESALADPKPRLIVVRGPCPRYEGERPT
jgi:indolepyruvate ferredoxin oxidoreductase alpha subunit